MSVAAHIAAPPWVRPNGEKPCATNMCLRPCNPFSVAETQLVPGITGGFTELSISSAPTQLASKRVLLRLWQLFVDL